MMRSGASAYLYFQASFIPPALNLHFIPPSPRHKIPAAFNEYYQACNDTIFVCERERERKIEVSSLVDHRV